MKHLYEGAARYDIVGLLTGSAVGESGYPDGGGGKAGVRGGGVVDREDAVGGRHEAVVPDVVSDFGGEGE